MATTKYYSLLQHDSSLMCLTLAQAESEGDEEVFEKDLCHYVIS